MEQPKKTERKVNVSFTLKGFKAYIEKMENAKILTKDETKNLKDIHRNATLRWIGMEIEIKV